MLFYYYTMFIFGAVTSIIYTVQNIIIHYIHNQKHKIMRKLANRLLKLPISKYYGHFSTTIITNQYNFYVDFKGLMYFDDGTPFLYPNCIKDVKFITQFYKNLKETNRNEGNGDNCTKQGKDSKIYPYEAQFWGQKNNLRYAISPVIFNHIDKDGNLRFSIQQKIPFDPHSLELDKEGRIWHPFRDGIKGVFSNDLIANCMEEVENQGNRVVYKYNGNKYEIKNMVS